MDNKNENNELAAATTITDSITSQTVTAPPASTPLQQNAQPLKTEAVTIRKASTLVSVWLLVLISVLTAFIGLAMSGLSDVVNLYDFILPYAVTIPLIFTIGMVLGKRWALIGFTGYIIIFNIVIVLYYHGKSDQMLINLAGLCPVYFILLYIWSAKRSLFT